MSQIRFKNTKIELAVFSALRKMKIYFQRHYKRIVGSPDIAMSRKKVAVFIDGDFWHGTNFLKKKKMAKKYWRDKIESNILRDRRNRVKLKKQGWKVLRIWEHEIKNNLPKAISRIEKLINK